MSQTNETKTIRTTVYGSTATAPLLRKVQQALFLSAEYSKELMKPDGHWCGENKGNATITAEYVFLFQALGLDLEPNRQALISWLQSVQRSDGSWSLAPHYPGDISVTVEAYLALKILGVPAESRAMRKAKGFALRAGGVAKVRILTRITLAMFGLLPWAAVPEMPAELILAPANSPIGIYRLSSWARATVVPLLVVCHHRPIYGLPNGRSDSNTYLDELWCNPTEKTVPYSDTLWNLWAKDCVSFAFGVTDCILHSLNGLRRLNPLRGYAIRECIDWILKHQEKQGDLAGIMPPLYGALYALTLQGYALDSDPVRRGLKAIERFAFHDERGRRIQTTVSPVWDTIWMSMSLMDAGMAPDSPWIQRAVQWLRNRQNLTQPGDWQVYNPRLEPGGFSFEYFNTWYPDLDDTAVAVIAMIRQDTRLSHLPSITRALNWLVGMQNSDGGFGAFDKGNDKLFLNKCPFSDMNGLCDPSTADITGHVLEAFGHFIELNRKQRLKGMDAELLDRLMGASNRAINYLSRTQEPSGAWYGRWGCNYIYGTSGVLCGLAYFIGYREEHGQWRERDDGIADNVSDAIHWLMTIQNADGGWGETLHSYQDPLRAGSGSSTASQTAWALMALLSYLAPSANVIQRGIQYLIRTQTQCTTNGATWPEKYFTGTALPGYFYQGYALYPHYFPTLALGRYAQSLGQQPLREYNTQR
ncbi:hypothetical protein ETB97_003363 [Aspergillus alliaceus]|uniref:Terpene cyclase/mutase family member n=1 Tax=Petromyces alliaceus TaxID=209559 RepID=A0A8H6AFK4_PETAA|nr:hypothetical protein ETB97_003363 [Aspergillus burnettii]